MFRSLHLAFALAVATALVAVMSAVPINGSAATDGAATRAANGGAATSKRVGARIDLHAGAYQTFPSGQPFHIAHGWGLGHDSSDQAFGKFGFSLAVDGIETSPGV